MSKLTRPNSSVMPGWARHYELLLSNGPQFPIKVLAFQSFSLFLEVDCCTALNWFPGGPKHNLLITIYSKS
jgi:hypothetical protein